MAPNEGAGKVISSGNWTRAIGECGTRRIVVVPLDIHVQHISTVHRQDSLLQNPL